MTPEEDPRGAIPGLQEDLRNVQLVLAGIVTGVAFQLDPKYGFDSVAVGSIQNRTQLSPNTIRQVIMQALTALNQNR